MELAFLSAVEQARLVRGGEVSSVELVRALPRADRAPRSRSSTPSSPSARTRRSPTRGEHRRERRGRAVPRRPDRREGPHRDRRHPDDLLLPRVRRQRPRLRHRRRAPDPRGGVRHRRQDEHAGVRDRRVHRVGAERRNAEPVEPGPHPRRVERRRSGRARGGPRSHRSRTDGGGSIRIPASCCGLFGLKPSRGRVSTAPFTSLEGLSTAGPLTRSVEDAARSWTCSPATSPAIPGGRRRPSGRSQRRADRPRRLRVAVTSTPPIDVPVDPRLRRRRARSAAALLAELGHDVVEATPPWREPGLFDTFIAVWQVGPALYPVDDRAPDAAQPRARRARHARAPPRTTRAAVARLQLLARRIVAFWERLRRRPDADARAAPGADRLAGTTSTARSSSSSATREFTPFTAVANLTGLPAMSLPLHWSDDGLPIGVQAIGPPAGDALLLGLAAQLEAARPWGDRAAADLARSAGERDPDLLSGRGVQHPRRASSRDRERHVLVAVLVEDHVARPRVGERPRHHRVVALARELELDARSRDDPELLDVVAVEVEGDVAEAVDVEERRVDRAVGDDRLRQIEPNEALRIDGRAELREGDPVRQMRRSGAEEIASVERPRDRLERVVRDSPARAPPRCPARLAAGSSSPLSGPTYSRPSSSRSASGRLGPPTPGSTIARWTPTGMNPIVFARTSAPCRIDFGGIPCVMSMICASGAMRLMTPWQVPTKSSLSPKSLRNVMNTRGA